MSLMRALLVALVAAALSCAPAAKTSKGQAYKAELRARFKSFETPGLTIGDFPLASEKAILDGDTIKVEGLNASLRLLGVDTEETFKKDKERRAYAAGWARYKAEARGDASRPVKFATPIGDEGKHFAEDFFKDALTVRLERDHPKGPRLLRIVIRYVFVEKNGKLLNYNARSSAPSTARTSTKYGQSRRFHAEFLAAEAEARAQKRGIWDPRNSNYDYEERKPWWDARGQFIHEFEQSAEGKDNYIILTNWDAMKRLEEHIGKEVVLLGGIGRINPGGPGPARVQLARRRGQNFTVVFFDREVFAQTGIEGAEGEYAAVKGLVSRYENTKRGTYELQIVVRLPGQSSAGRNVRAAMAALSTRSVRWERCRPDVGVRTDRGDGPPGHRRRHLELTTGERNPLPARDTPESVNGAKTVRPRGRRVQQRVVEGRRSTIASTTIPARIVSTGCSASLVGGREVNSRSSRGVRLCPVHPAGGDDRQRRVRRSRVRRPPRGRGVWGACGW